jgi:ABC-type transport system involved in cytochrome bd biosynthesis fused ATPase/permease subunit
MALSVSIGNEFIILLIAIVFHRKSTYNGHRFGRGLTRLQKPLKDWLSALESLLSSGLKARCSLGSWPSPMDARKY